MQLKYDFPLKVRLLYLYHYSCFLCGRNYPLEIHHILGRVSASAFNSSCLCRICHERICHNREEHRKIFALTFKFLLNADFVPDDEDMKFLEKYFDELGVGLIVHNKNLP